MGEGEREGESEGESESESDGEGEGESEGGCEGEVKGKAVAGEAGDLLVLLARHRVVGVHRALQAQPPPWSGSQGQA